MCSVAIPVASSRSTAARYWANAALGFRLALEMVSPILCQRRLHMPPQHELRREIAVVEEALALDHRA